ncbi:response regulator transcription factor [Streptomyces himalayensis]|uniref:Response regulator transcription factor n=1 Tax=Streptomyces himalayensis subsp. himalayensis TaxID=2756131 RepID=A0A7W0I8V6_9ACTN|nr:response regulator transcription factor [Streptomyces himalayensis]MBA2946742.1 response regulator transcription factor [Streptomyces himalayensis subsp. himalayensis]
MSIGLFVIDDHPIVQAGIENVFVDEDEFELLGAATTLAQAVSAVRARPPDVILLDVRLGDTDVTAAVTALCVAAPVARIVLFTADPRNRQIPAARRAGAVTTVPKDTAPAELRAAIRAVHDGSLRDEPAPERALLTPRQHDVLACVANGMTNNEIAQELGLRPTTVKAYWQETLQRMGARNRADAIAIAYRLGLF